MAEGLGMQSAEMPIGDQYYLQGLEPDMTYNGQRWIRLASLYPEKINYVDFYRDEKLIFTAYDEPFSVNFKSNWRQTGIDILDDKSTWLAVIHLRNGEIIKKQRTVT
jgi:hypothetical protein